MHRWIVAGLALFLAACASAPPPEGTILFLPPVAGVTLVTAAGLREPRADWSGAAMLNLAEALSVSVSEADTDWALINGAAANALAQEMAAALPAEGSAPAPADFSLLPDRTDLVALITLRTDVESSASRLVQGGLGVLFGGVPGPDGIERAARLCLYGRSDGAQVWCHEAGGKDARAPDGAVSVINSLLAPLQPEDSH